MSQTISTTVSNSENVYTRLTALIEQLVNRQMDECSFSKISRQYAQQVAQTFVVVTGPNGWAEFDYNLFGTFPTFEKTDLNIAFNSRKNKDHVIASVLFSNMHKIYNVFVEQDRRRSGLLLQLLVQLDNPEYLQLANRKLKLPKFKANAHLDRKLSTVRAKYNTK